MGIKVAVVGLNFGAYFVPIYRDHPDVDDVVIVEQDESVLDAVRSIGIRTAYRSLDEALADDSIDAVHVFTPPQLHAPMSIQVLQAGKHCASAIPAALEMDDLHELVRLQASSGRNYMMMETDAVTREALHARQLLAEGAFGEVSFGRGHHYQDMTGWPSYWDGFPPHLNITHAIGPLLMLLDTRATSVRCLGSGRLPESMRENRWGNPYPVETAIFELERGDVAIEVTRSMFQMTRNPSSGFALYGNRLGFEWPQMSYGEGEHPIYFEATEEFGLWSRGERRPAPDFSHLLPESIRPYALDSFSYDIGKGTARGGDLGGSYPHLVHEFVSSIVEGRLPWMDAVRGADMTGAGISAHRSAMEGGSIVEIPDFRASAG